MDITNKRLRLSLPWRDGDAPYYRKISDGKYLGWRPLLHGGGKWVARIRKDKRYCTQTLEGAVEWSDALEAAQAFFLSIEGAVIDRRNATVDDAFQEYLTTLQSDGRADTFADAQGRYNRTVKGSKLAEIQLRSLTSDHLNAWKRDLHKTALAANDGDSIGANHSTNRNLITLKAALNCVFKRSQNARWVHDDSAWRVVKAYPTKHRSRFSRSLSKAERKRFLTTGCAPYEFRDDGSRDDRFAESRKAIKRFVIFLMLSGLRPGAAAALRVRDFDPTTKELNIPVDKANAGRRIGTTSRLAHILEILCRGREAGEHIFLRPGKESRTSRHATESKPWDKDSWTAAIERAAERAGICDCTAYSFRHACATDLLLAGVPVAVVAYRLGTSIKMLEKFYAHLQNGALEQMEAALY